MYPEDNENVSNFDRTNSAKTIGQKLQEARIAEHKTIEEVAAQLRLADKFIVDLENDDFSKFSSPVYVKGYLRSYLKLLKLPEEEILKQLSLADLGGIVAAHQPQLIGNHQPFLTKKHLQWMIYGAVSIMLFGYIFWRNANPSEAVNPNALVSDQTKPTIPIEVTNLQDEMKSEDNQVAQTNQEPINTEEVSSENGGTPQGSSQNETISQNTQPNQNNSPIDMKSVNDTNFDPQSKVRTFNQGTNPNDNRR